MLTTAAFRLAQLGDFPPDRLTGMHRSDRTERVMESAVTGLQEPLMRSSPIDDTLHLGVVAGTIEMVERAQ